jgi:DNA-binding PadR family transcriptional regulator
MPVPRRSVLAMAVLSMLTEEPMHAYRMQQLVKERHKDDVINVSQRNSIYQTIQRLVRDELVEVEATGRAENRPERTTYRITDAGRRALRDWLDAMVSTPAGEFPEFPAALAFLPNLAPKQAIAALATRADRLRARVDGLAEELTQGATFLPRIFLIETEYQQRVLQAELDYVTALLDDLRAGRLSWPDDL